MKIIGLEGDSLGLTLGLPVHSVRVLAFFVVCCVFFRSSLLFLYLFGAQGSVRGWSFVITVFLVMNLNLRGKKINKSDGKCNFF